jgi:hydrogenase maturation factor HypF (carbamoyltransferase family)
MTVLEPVGVRKPIEIRGIVQGVGFRPFVYCIAKRFDMRGWGAEFVAMKVIVECCERLGISHSLSRVCLSGGTFQNIRLLGHAAASLRESGFEVFVHHRVPANDRGLALGQAVIASSRLRLESAAGHGEG